MFSICNWTMLHDISVQCRRGVKHTTGCHPDHQLVIFYYSTKYIICRIWPSLACRLNTVKARLEVPCIAYPLNKIGRDYKNDSNYNLWVYYTVSFGFSLLRHFLGITFRGFNLLCLAVNHWWGFSTQITHIVLFLFKMVYRSRVELSFF